MSLKDETVTYWITLAFWCRPGLLLLTECSHWAVSIALQFLQFLSRDGTVLFSVESNSSSLPCNIYCNGKSTLSNGSVTGLHP